MVNRKTYEQGLAVRREVLGSDYVDRSMAHADSFTREWQEWVTEWCWGGLWTRPGLPRKSRSLVNLGMLAALNRPHEIKIHVRGALNNGVTREEIAKVFFAGGRVCRRAGGDGRISCGQGSVRRTGSEAISKRPPRARGLTGGGIRV